MKDNKVPEQNYKEAEEKGLALKDQENALDLFGGDMASKVWTSLPMDGTREAQVKIFNAMGDAHSLSDHKDKVIEVQHILAHSVQIETDDEGAVPASRFVLITPEGERYATVADGIRSSLQNIMAMFGKPPFNPAIKIIPKEVKTRRGFKTLRLDLSE